MSNDDLRELNLNKTLDVLKKFCENVINQENFKQVNNKLIGKAQNALTIQNNFVKNIEYLKEYINPKIFDNDKFINNLVKKKSDIDLNIHDSLKVLIDFYNEVDKTDSFTTEELQPVWKALKHQINLTDRFRNIGLELATEGVCGKRPRTRVNLPDEPR